MGTFARLIVVAISLLAASCGFNTSEFNEGKAKGMLEADPVTLESEQVSLTTQQIDCGVQNELWETPIQVSKERVVARLLTQGRALNFSDDVAVVETGFRQPYVQVRGSFMVQVNEVTSMSEGKEQGTEIVNVRAGVRVNHACFADSLPIMGIKKGAFSADAPAAFQFGFQTNGWHVERMIH
jgi:hypothetical protein